MRHNGLPSLFPVVVPPLGAPLKIRAASKKLAAATLESQVCTPPPPPPGGWWPCWGVRRTPQHRVTQPCSFYPSQEKILSISSPGNSFSSSQSDSLSTALLHLHTGSGLSNRQGHPQGGLHGSSPRFNVLKRAQRKFQTYGLTL